MRLHVCFQIHEVANSAVSARGIVSSLARLKSQLSAAKVQIRVKFKDKYKEKIGKEKIQ